jgi:hypothetical protein
LAWRYFEEQPASSCPSPLTGVAALTSGELEATDGNGTSWRITQIPGTRPLGNSPVLSGGSEGTCVVTYVSSNAGKIEIFASHDDGLMCMASLQSELLATRCPHPSR